MIQTAATLDDLMRVGRQGRTHLREDRDIDAQRILAGRDCETNLLSLEKYVENGAPGTVVPDPVAYGFDQPLPSGRQSFCPDISFYTGRIPKKHMGYVRGFPIFAVEVRSESDYGPAQDRENEDKRTDYFTAGTEIVWDVDPEAETIAAYRAGNPTSPIVYRVGDVADAEPVLPGWRLKLDELFA